MSNKRKTNKAKKSSTKNGSTPLSGYSQSKKVLTPPLATLPNMVLSSWMNDRMPEMLWAVLVREKHTGSIGYAIFRDVLSWLSDNRGSAEINGVTHSDIANLEPILKKSFISHIVKQAGTDALRPLLSFPDLPAYDVWREVMAQTKTKPEEDWDFLASSVSSVLFHQTQEATDVRWVKLMGTLLAGKLHLPEEMFDKLNHYPNKYDQRSVRPSIRSSEMMDMFNEGDRPKWTEDFWRFAQEETICIPEINTHTKDEIEAKYKDVSDDKKFYDKSLRDIRNKLISHFYDNSVTTKIDSRHETVMGLALYAHDVFVENSILLTAGTVSGRVTSRIIFEAYITLKYLLHKENNSDQMWDTYREYGSGQVSLIERKYEDEHYQSAMVDLKKMDSIANEDKWSEYVPINIGNWESSDLRKMSIAVGEKGLYDKYYPYTSGFIHANWGAVRESSMQTCLNPLHRLHRIPNYGLPILPNVNEDCLLMLNKIYQLVDQAYPSFKSQIKKRSKQISYAWV